MPAPSRSQASTARTTPCVASGRNAGSGSSPCGRRSAARARSLILVLLGLDVTVVVTVVVTRRRRRHVPAPGRPPDHDPGPALDGRRLEPLPALEEPAAVN